MPNGPCHLVVFFHSKQRIELLANRMLKFDELVSRKVNDWIYTYVIQEIPEQSYVPFHAESRQWWSWTLWAAEYNIWAQLSSPSDGIFHVLANVILTNIHLDQLRQQTKSCRKSSMEAIPLQTCFIKEGCESCALKIRIEGRYDELLTKIFQIGNKSNVSWDRSLQIIVLQV
jgi:hypothetical protein